MKPTPVATFGCHPLKGATLTAWQSQFRSVCLEGDRDGGW
jgi:hypothetical protein